VDTGPATWSDLAKEGKAFGLKPQEVARRVRELVQDGVLVREGNGYYPTDIARALGVKWWLMQAVKRRGVEKINNLSEDEQMRGIRGFGFKTKKEVIRLLQEYEEAVKRRKNEGAGH
jgi:DNA-binding Lrp family transcriptional regulator